MRYCYVHDSTQGENFHIRCRNSTLEYNWFARAMNYEGDLMTDDDFTGAGPFSQTMTLRGNVFLQNSLPVNHSQVVVLYNDAGAANLTLSLRALYNTFVGANTNSAFVHLSNADGTPMIAEISNNIIYGTKTPLLVEDPAMGVATGANNWLPTNASSGALIGSVQSSSPGFLNAAARDFTLANGSVCIGSADATVYGLPGREYYRNEITNREWRVRAAARDLGAFESTSRGIPVGPYNPTPQPQLSIIVSGMNAVVGFPLYASDFQFQESALADPSGWNVAAYGSATNGTGILVSVPLSAGSKFFRLEELPPL